MVDQPMLPYQKCALNQIKITTENDTKVTSTEQIIIQTVTELYRLFDKKRLNHNFFIYYPISMNKKTEDMVFHALRSSHKIFFFWRYFQYLR
jgi:hypothetical protein